MQIIISPAKTFALEKKDYCPDSLKSNPYFIDNASEIVSNILALPISEIKKQLKISDKLCKEFFRALSDFNNTETPKQSAIVYYSGMVFKKIQAKDFDLSQWEWIKDHLFITSFVYGLLKPTDVISKYRLEGTAHIPKMNTKNVFEYWKPILTDILIEKTKKNGGELLFLASQEMKDMFHWDRVEESVRVVEPFFETITDDGTQTKQIVIYTKMCRGSMLSLIVRNGIDNIDDIKTLSPNGFYFSDEDSSDSIFKFYSKV